MGDFSAPEILHLGSGSERRDEDKHSDLAERKQSASLGIYSAEKFTHYQRIYFNLHSRCTRCLSEQHGSTSNSWDLEEAG